MDILIKNMEMPKSCDDCRFTEQGQGYLICAITGNYAIDSTYKSCPLVALPHHGDLIDRSLLKGASYEIIRFPYDEAVRMFIEAINEAPTIVEAST